MLPSSRPATRFRIRRAARPKRTVRCDKKYSAQYGTTTLGPYFGEVRPGPALGPRELGVLWAETAALGTGVAWTRPAPGPPLPPLDGIGGWAASATGRGRWGFPLEPDRPRYMTSTKSGMAAGSGCVANSTSITTTAVDSGRGLSQLTTCHCGQVPGSHTRNPQHDHEMEHQRCLHNSDGKHPHDTLCTPAHTRNSAVGHATK